MNTAKPKGYIKRPWELNLLPWIFLAAPLLNLAGWWVLDAFASPSLGLFGLIQVNYGTFSRGSWDIVRGLFLLIPYALGLAAALGLWVVRPWGFWLCASYGVLAWLTSSWNFVLVSGTTEVQAPVFAPFQPAALANLAFFIPVLILLQRDLVAPFFESHLRWWEQHKRLRLNIPLTVELEKGAAAVQTFDLSLKGCFVAGPTDWPLNKDLKARLSLPDRDSPVELQLRALWSTPGSKHYPAGVGCEFRQLSPGARRRLEIFLKSQIKEGKKPHLRD